jgi:hypothetical protein
MFLGKPFSSLVAFIEVSEGGEEKSSVYSGTKIYPLWY